MNEQTQPSEAARAATRDIHEYGMHVTRRGAGLSERDFIARNRGYTEERIQQAIDSECARRTEGLWDDFGWIAHYAKAAARRDGNHVTADDIEKAIREHAHHRSQP